MQIANRCAPVKIANSAENGNWSSLYSLGTELMENTASLLRVQMLLRSHDGYRPFPTNGRLC
jgi:hypothetical protein